MRLLHDMTSSSHRRADADLRHDTAALLVRLADAVQSGQVPRWQILAALEAIQQAARLLRPALSRVDTTQTRRQAEKDTVPHV